MIMMKLNRTASFLKIDKILTTFVLLRADKLLIHISLAEQDSSN